MVRTFAISFLIVPFLFSCRGIRSIPANYAGYQERERPHLLAIFMDGTMEKPRKKKWKNSHVMNTYSLAFNNIRSLYIEGVGAGNRILQALKAGTTYERIARAYRFLSENYRPGDSICLFGFSRGANQCRILSSFIYTIGIIDLKQIKSESEKQQLLLDLFDQYLDTIDASGSGKKIKLAGYLNSWNFKHPGQEISYDTSGATMIELMGLWDTVEALEVGDKQEITTPIPQHLNQLYNIKKLFHVVSLDDNRAFNYTPILVTHKDVLMKSGQVLDSIVDEVWFNGSHKDVGGGVSKKEKNQLTGISLKWMLTSVSSYHIFRDTAIMVNEFGMVNNMRGNLFLKLFSPEDSLRGINKYWESMNVNWNNHRIRVHQSVINRLDAGIVQQFKLKKGKKDRMDWYDWVPFNICFKKETINGKKKIIFLKEDCPCIEVVGE